MLAYDGHTSEVGARHPGMGEHRIRGPLVSRSSQSITPTLTYYLMQRGVLNFWATVLGPTPSQRRQGHPPQSQWAHQRGRCASP